MVNTDRSRARSPLQIKTQMGASPSHDLSPKPRIETSKARHTRINGQDVIEVTATVANDGETGPISLHARVFTDKGRWEQRETVVLVPYRTADFRFLFFDVQGTAPRFSLFFNNQSAILSDPVP